MSKLVGPEIGKNLAVHINDRRKFLPREANHFIVGRLVGNHVNGFVINFVLVEPPLGFVTPPAIWLHEQTYSFRFHIRTLRDKSTFFKCELIRGESMARIWMPPEAAR
jgi:hypothetical protein